MIGTKLCRFFLNIELKYINIYNIYLLCRYINQFLLIEKISYKKVLNKIFFLFLRKNRHNFVPIIVYPTFIAPD